MGSAIRLRYGSANAPTPFRAAAWEDVLLLELAVRLEDHEGDAERQIVTQVGAELLVGALGVGGHPLEVLLELRVVVDVEMVRRVDVPVELVVLDAVLAVVRRELLGAGRRGNRRGEEHDQRGHPPSGLAFGVVADHVNLAAAGGPGSLAEGQHLQPSYPVVRPPAIAGSSKARRVPFLPAGGRRRLSPAGDACGLAGGRCGRKRVRRDA